MVSPGADMGKDNDKTTRYAFDVVECEALATLAASRLACTILPLRMASWASVRCSSGTSCRRWSFFQACHCSGLRTRPSVLIASFIEPKASALLRPLFPADADCEERERGAFCL